MVRWKDIRARAKEILKDIFSQPIGIAAIILLVVMVALAVLAPIIAGNASYENWNNISFWKDNPTAVPPAWISIFGKKYSVNRFYTITSSEMKTVQHVTYLAANIPASTTVTYYANYTDNYTAEVPYTDVILYIYPAINWTLLGKESFQDIMSLLQNKTILKVTIAGYVNNITKNATSMMSPLSSFLDRYVYVMKATREKIKSTLSAGTLNATQKRNAESALATVGRAITLAERLKKDIVTLQTHLSDLSKEIAYLSAVKPPETYKNATPIAKALYNFTMSLKYLNETTLLIYNDLGNLTLPIILNIGTKYYGAGFNTTIMPLYEKADKALKEAVSGIQRNISELMSITYISAVVSDVEDFMKIHGATGIVDMEIQRPDGLKVAILQDVPISPVGVNRIDAKSYITDALISLFTIWDPYSAYQITNKLIVSNPLNLLFVKWPHYTGEQTLMYLYENLTEVKNILSTIPVYLRSNYVNETLQSIIEAQKVIRMIYNASSTENIGTYWKEVHDQISTKIGGIYAELKATNNTKVEEALPYLKNAMSLFSNINNELNIVTLTSMGTYQVKSITKAELYNATILPVSKLMQAMYHPVPLQGSYKWSIRITFTGTYPTSYLTQLIQEYVSHKISKIPAPEIALTVTKVVSKQLGASYGILGTDVYGRDLWKGFVWGTRAALIVGLIVSVLSSLIGLIYGSVSGYIGGLADEVMQRIVEIMVTLPFFPILIMIGYSMQGGMSYWMVALLLVVFGWAGLARVIRSMALQIREYTFVEAARCLGASTGRILVKHVMPQMLPYLFAQMAFSVPGAIITAASLAFLGVGDIVHPTWGSILHAAQANGAVVNNEWWWVIPPGIGMMIIGLGFVFLGMALDRVLNPRLRRM